MIVIKLGERASKGYAVSSLMIQLLDHEWGPVNDFSEWIQRFEFHFRVVLGDRKVPSL